MKFIYRFMSKLTGDPDEIKLCRLLRLLGADGLNGQLELLPVERILDP